MADKQLPIRSMMLGERERAREMLAPSLHLVQNSIASSFGGQSVRDNIASIYLAQGQVHLSAAHPHK